MAGFKWRYGRLWPDREEGRELFDFQDGMGAVFHRRHPEEHPHGLGDTALAADDLALIFIGDVETEDDAAVLIGFGDYYRVWVAGQ